MTQVIPRELPFYAFNPDLLPVAEVDQGEEFIIETHDAFQGQLKKPGDLVTSLDWNHTNPATGPIYIHGTKPGNVLKVDILQVVPSVQSVMIAFPNEGALGDRISKMETKILKSIGNELIFSENLRIVQNPMVGVIGVAPEKGSIANALPGPHGGNMDCKLVKEGASLYFTVAVDGALLGAGDLHAAQGDGEIVVCGAETMGIIRVRANVINEKWLPTPMLQNDSDVVVIHSAPSLDEAASGAIHRMADFLTDIVGIPINDAGMLMSLVGQLCICQVVDPLKTVRFEFPKEILLHYGYQLE